MMTIPSVRESHLSQGTSNFVPWKCKLHSPLEAGNFWYPYGGGKTSYKSQIFGRIKKNAMNTK